MKKYNIQFAGEERPYNFAFALLIRCDLLFIKANESSVMGDFNVWVRVLKALKRSISFKLTDEEESELQTDLDNVQSSLSLKNVQNYSIESALDKIESRIVDLMYKYGLYYPKYKERKNWEEEAENEDL